MWSMTLAVRLDEPTGRFFPELNVFGPPSFAGGALRLELVDERGSVCHADRRDLRPDELGTGIALRAFDAPREALRWPWEVAIEGNGIELIRWRRYLAASDRLTPEAEIDLPGSANGLRPKAEDEGVGPEAPWDSRDSQRLIAQLTQEGILRPEDAQAILAERALTGCSAERNLIERGILSEHEVLFRYAAISGCEFVDLEAYPIDPEAVGEIPEDVARRLGAVAIGFHGELLTVAMSDPQREPWDVADLYAATGSPIYIVVATRADVFRVLDRRHLISEGAAR
jgi:hypothetical protein